MALHAALMLVWQVQTPVVPAKLGLLCVWHLQL